MGAGFVERVERVGPGCRFAVEACRSFKATYDWVMWVLALVTLVVALVVGFAYGIAWALCVVFGVLAVVFFIAGREAYKVINLAEADTFDVELLAAWQPGTPIGRSSPPALPFARVLLDVVNHGSPGTFRVAVEAVQNVTLPALSRSWNVGKVDLQGNDDSWLLTLGSLHAYPSQIRGQQHSWDGGVLKYTDDRGVDFDPIPIPGVVVDAEHGMADHDSLLSADTHIDLRIRVDEVGGRGRVARWDLGIGFTREEPGLGTYEPRFIGPTQVEVVSSSNG